MKRLIGILLFGLLTVAATTMYLETEKKYTFTAENLATTIPEFIEDEKKQEALAKKWVELMDTETGAVSVADMFAACRAGGFNTYKVTGYEQCRAFIVKLLENAEAELDEDFLNGYCPGLDEKGKNPNALSTITDKTRIGGPCSSSRIYAGEVTFRKGYNCTCTAYACNSGYEFKSGRCVTIVADGEGNCLRKEFPKTDKVNTTAKAVEFCQNYANKNKCKLLATNMLHSQSKIVCNPTQVEIDNVKAGMLANKDKQIANLQYYEVCGKHKGKTGKKEYCVYDLFKDVDVGLNEASGLCQLYAKTKHGKTIYCDTKYRAESNDDLMKCATLEKDVFYEFRFDDLSESSDATKFQDTVRGISLIYGGKWNGYNISGNCTKQLNNAAKKFGMKTSERYGVCVFEYGTKVSSEKTETGLHTIDGIDSRVFYYGIQIQGSTDLRNQLKAYIQRQGFLVTAFDCDNGYGRVKTSWTKGDDDILTCRLTATKDGQRYNNKTIDFIFDDVSENFKYKQDAGQSAIQCIVSGGKYQGSTCHGLTQQQCKQSDAALKKKFPGISGTKWENGQCVMIDAAEAKKYDIAIQAGIGLISAVDCVVLTHTGCAILAVELTGLATEVGTGIAIENRANEFLKESVKCKSRSCAKTTIRSLAPKVLSVKDGLTAQDFHAVDEELARLVELLEPEDLQSEVSANDWDDIVRQLGGDPNDNSGTALIVANKIGFFAQFASIGASAFRLTGKALAKLGAKASSKTGTKVAAVATAKGADMVSDAARGSKVGKVASLKDEFKSIGVNESKTYRDIKTGKMLSRDEVLKRIDDLPDGPNRASMSLSDELAEIGVREESVYRDIASNKFISQDEVLRRIDEMPGTGAASAGDVAGASKPNEKLLDIFGGATGSGAGRVVRGGENTVKNTDELLNVGDDIRNANNAIGMGGIDIAKYNNIGEIKKINFDDLMKEAKYDNVAEDFVRNDLVNNQKFFEKIGAVYNQEIMKIGNTPVKIVDYGSDSNRAIVMVDVGGRKIPFYVSTGSAGKINVPTGKWEVFWGLGDSGWFNKSREAAINSHYGSTELRQIASKLDDVLGDPRNRLYINSSKIRANSGGVGLVADVDNMAPISAQTVNSGFKYKPNYSATSGEPNMQKNIDDITNYLRSLR